MRTLIQDIRYAIRIYSRRAGFSAIAVLALAIGIGANTAMFSVIDAVLLRPLPYSSPDRLVNISTTDTREPGAAGGGAVSYPDFYDWKAQADLFDGMAIYSDANFTLTGAGEPVHISSLVASHDLFPLLGVKPLLGRTFVPQDDRPGAVNGTNPVILSTALWKDRFGSDKGIIGRTITLSDKSYTVVGVMPAGFQYPIQAEPIQAWVTPAIYPPPATGASSITNERGNHQSRAIGRLKSGVSLQQAQAQISTIADRLSAKYPDTNSHFGVHLIPEFQNLVGDVRPSLILLFVAVGCVLLIACANVANLLLARAASRQKEIAIRCALGAGRKRVVRQLLTESVLLSLAGAVLGILGAIWGIGLLMKLAPENVPRLSEVGINWTVLGFTVLVALLTGTLFGVAPALQLSRHNLSNSLKEGGRESTDSSRGKHLGAVFVVGEVAVATVLLLVAGLLLKSFNRLRQVNPGFNPNNVLTAVVDLPRARYSQQQRVQFERDLLTRVAAVPAVKSAGGVFPAPLSGDGISVGLQVEGRADQPGHLPESRVTIITPDYFQTMGIHLIAGRPFAPTDDDKSSQVVIVNRTLAEKYFGVQNAVGKPVGPTISSGDDTPMREIVGVVDDVKYSTLTENASAALYLPHAQLPFNPMEIVVRTEGDPRAIMGGLKRSVGDLDKSLPIFSVGTMDEYLGRSVATQRFSTLLLSAFAGIALLLALIGLYGVLAYTVAQRTHEFGLRMALGAARGTILRNVLTRGLALVGFGLVLGLGGAYAAGRLVEGMLFGITAADPVTFVAVAVSFAVVGTVACLAPAVRATRVDPMVALHYE